jgi:hypothetical protein
MYGSFHDVSVKLASVLCSQRLLRFLPQVFPLLWLSAYVAVEHLNLLETKMRVDNCFLVCLLWGHVMMRILARTSLTMNRYLEV